MNTDELEHQLRGTLRETLDRELGPDPTWAESPAARRVAELARVRRRWPLRVLAVAALIGAGGGAALLAGTLRPPDVSAEPANGWIAFTVEEADLAGGGVDTDIWFVALGQEPRRVIGTHSDGVDQLCPAFAPDGRSLAYGSVEGVGGDQHDAARRAAYRNSALVIADVADDGTVSDRVTIDVGDGLPPPCPVWSADGDQLAFGVPRTSPINPDRSGDDSEVWVMRVADQRITVLPDLLATDLDWSPDGSLLAIVGGVETASGEGVKDGLQDARIHLYEPSSGTMRSLDGTLGAYQLTWSPDGGRIAYAGGDGPADDDQGHVLRIIDVETGRQEVITSAFRAIHGIGPVWSPDGETIVYQRRVGCCEAHEVVMVTPGDRSQQTGLVREVVIAPDDTGLGLFPWRVSWSPDSEHLLYLAWSYPDGCCDEGTVELRSLVAVPTDLDAPSVLLVDMDGMLVHDGYDDITYVPVQIWGRDPFPSSGLGVTLSASPSPSATAPASASPTVDLIGDWLDTSRWTTYASERYQFTIGHPATWTVIESTHIWDQETDSINWDSGALEAFVPPDNTISIYLAAWSVDVDPATTLAEWGQAFCDQYVASCTDVEGMSEPAFANEGDLEGILLSWDDGMAAFFPTWYDEAEPGSIWEQPATTDGRIYIVESGRPDSGPYHSRELMEALSQSLCPGCGS